MTIIIILLQPRESGVVFSKTVPIFNCFFFRLAFLTRFWLSRAIEGFLRGRASVGDQLFLIKRGLLEVLHYLWIFVFIILRELN